MKNVSIYHSYLLPILILVAGAGIFKACQSLNNATFSDLPNSKKMRGVCWESTRDSTREAHIQSLTNHRVNWISQTPFGWQTGVHNPEISFRSTRDRQKRRERGLVRVAKMARAKGIKTLLKPHIWIRQANGKWRSDIQMNSAEEWEQWFEGYEAFILHYAELAEQHGFEGLCIGTELLIPSTQHEQRWRTIIAKIREVYSGQLTYAANFYKEYEGIKFWDALDFIGIQGYFPLTHNEKPTLEELKRGWMPHYQKIKEIQAQWQKTIVFTEIGYRSSKDAAIRPWEWEKKGKEVNMEEICHQTQALCYQAAFETFWKEDWVGGFFIWKWTPEIYSPPSETRNRRRRPSPLSFTPKQPAREVVKKWYGE